MRALDLDGNDDIGFVHKVRPIIDGVLRIVEPPVFYVVKVDSWFGDKWLGFSNKLAGAVGVQHRATLRVPPFVPSRVVSQRYFSRATNGEYVDGNAAQLHIEQTSEDNARRLMSVVCPDAGVFWWTGSTRGNDRGALMAYLPTPDGHTGWYAELEKTDRWRVARTVCTTARELSSYAATLGDTAE
jgi:hypothetical protein